MSLSKLNHSIYYSTLKSQSHSFFYCQIQSTIKKTHYDVTHESNDICHTLGFGLSPSELCFCLTTIFVGLLKYNYRIFTSPKFKCCWSFLRSTFTKRETVINDRHDSRIISSLFFSHTRNQALLTSVIILVHCL